MFHPLRYHFPAMDLGDRVSKQGKKPSPEERLGSTLHNDLPEIIPQELRDRSIPADDLNPHFAGANMRLWQRDDFISLLRFIEKNNNQRPMITVIEVLSMCGLSVSEGIARVSDEFENFEVEPDYFEYLEFIAYLTKYENMEDDEILFFAELSTIDHTNAKKQNFFPFLFILSITIAACWLLYGVFLLLRWLWSLVASWIG